MLIYKYSLKKQYSISRKSDIVTNKKRQKLTVNFFLKKMKKLRSRTTPAP
jgi:hypothetical protein